MRVVLDASVAIEIALGHKQAAKFAAVLAKAGEVLAPDLITAEATNAIWKYHHVQGLNFSTCERALRTAVHLPDRLVSSLSLYAEAFLLARTTRKPAYDMFYVALARREDAVLLTLDSRLKKEAEKLSIRVDA